MRLPADLHAAWTPAVVHGDVTQVTDLLQTAHWQELAPEAQQAALEAAMEEALRNHHLSLVQVLVPVLEAVAPVATTPAPWISLLKQAVIAEDTAALAHLLGHVPASVPLAPVLVAAVEDEPFSPERIALVWDRVDLTQDPDTVLAAALIYGRIEAVQRAVDQGQGVQLRGELIARFQDHLSPHQIRDAIDLALAELPMPLARAMLARDPHWPAISDRVFPRMSERWRAETRQASLVDRPAVTLTRPRPRS